MLSTHNIIAQETAQEIKFREAMNKDESKKALQMIPKIMAGGMQHLEAYPEEYAALMNLIGIAYAEIEENGKAITYYELALNRIGTAKSDTCFEYALYAYNLGMAYEGLGQYETADPYILYALPILANNYGAHSYEYTMMYYQYAIMYVDMGRYPGAEAMFNGLIYYFEQTSGMESEDYQNSLANLGRVYEGMGRYEEAEQLMLGVLEYYLEIGMDKASEISVGMNNLAQVYWKTARLADAEKMYKESLDIMNKAKLALPLDSATLLNNLALVYKTASRFPEAENAYRAAIAIYKRLDMKQHPDYTNPVNNLGELYRVMGRSEEAINSFIEVINLREQLYGSDHPNYANAVNNLGLVYFGLGYYPESEQMLLISKAIYKEKLGTGHESYANVLNNLAILYKAAGMPKESEEHYRECLEISKESIGANHPKYALYLNGASLLYGQLGKYEQSIQMLEEAISITKSAYGDKNYDYIDMVYNIAEIYREAGMKVLAKSSYVQAMEGYINLIHEYFPFLNEEDQTAFYHTVVYRFDTYNSFVIEDLVEKTGDVDPAMLDKMFNLQLQIKSMLLNEVASVREKAMNSANKELPKLFVKWQKNKEALIDAYAMSDDQLVLQEVDISVLERSASQLERQLNSGLYQSAINSPEDQIKWQDLAKELGDDEALVEMIRVDYYDKRWTDSVFYVALIVKKGSTTPELVVITEGVALETTHYTHYRKSIWNQLEDKSSYSLYWGPLKEKLVGINKVWLTPDGCYHKLNLYTLKNPNTNDYLINEVSIILQTNSKDFIKERKQKDNTNQNIEIFAYPNYYLTQLEEAESGNVEMRSLERYGYNHLPDLPGTKTEAENISASFKSKGWNVGLNLWTKASEEVLKSIASPNVLHIATHGYFLVNEVDYQEILEHRALRGADKNPLFRSGLILAGAGATYEDVTKQSNEDGIFSAYEAMQMDLSNTELVVLSACETGLGELHNGQGVYGLQRAFMA
ncbi:MAG: CHAT domain-containing protein, partial [Flavobacteriales bacterium]|nr:CHAT domain-containing protein [Flavobacteriales bacterium]